MWGWIRYRALILAMLPLVTGASLWFLFQNAKGWESLGFLIVFILSVPVLAGMAALSVIFAFRKDDDLRKLARTSKVASVVSLTLLGGLTLIGTAGAVESLWF